MSRSQSPSDCRHWSSSRKQSPLHHSNRLVSATPTFKDQGSRLRGLNDFTRAASVVGTVPSCRITLSTALPYTVGKVRAHANNVEPKAPYKARASDQSVSKPDNQRLVAGVLLIHDVGSDRPLHSSAAVAAASGAGRPTAEHNLCPSSVPPSSPFLRVDSASESLESEASGLPACVNLRRGHAVDRPSGNGCAETAGSPIEQDEGERDLFLLRSATR